MAASPLTIKRKLKLPKHQCCCKLDPLYLMWLMGDELITEIVMNLRLMSIKHRSDTKGRIYVSKSIRWSLLFEKSRPTWTNMNSLKVIIHCIAVTSHKVQSVTSHQQHNFCQPVLANNKKNKTLLLLDFLHKLSAERKAIPCHDVITNCRDTLRKIWQSTVVNWSYCRKYKIWSKSHY